MTASSRKESGSKGADKAPVRRRRVGQTVPSPLPGTSHVTPAGANIFNDLGFDALEAENLKIRSLLMNELRRIVGDMPQREAAALLGVTQPRVSHLMHGRIDLFTIDTLVNMLGHAGAIMRVSVRRGRSPSAA